MNVYLRSSNWQLPTIFEERLIASKQNHSGIFGTVEIDKAHKHYPNRGDTKIMRQDVIASILTIGDMLDQVDLSDEEREETALYVSNGSFLEEDNKHMNRLIRAFEKFTALKTKKEKRELLYKNIPPLTALETLTNSTMSFIAQYSGLKGKNTTFGTTSYSSFEAIKEGANQLKQNKAFHAVVGGANGGGIYSALNATSFVQGFDSWKESLCCGYLLMQSDPDQCHIKVDSLHNDRDVPSLLGLPKSNNWPQFFDQDKKVELVVYSGGFTDRQFEENKNVVEEYTDKCFSLNQQYGNTGAAAMFLNVMQAEKMMLSEEYSSALVVDRDQYGRETCIKLSKI